VVGYGKTESDVREFIAQQGLGQQVKMFGRIDNQTLMALYQKCPITLVPSISEGFGYRLGRRRFKSGRQQR